MGKRGRAREKRGRGVERVTVTIVRETGSPHPGDGDDPNAAERSTRVRVRSTLAPSTGEKLVQETDEEPVAKARKGAGRRAVVDVAPPPAEPAPKTLGAAVANLLFLGWMGGHRFYLDRKYGEVLFLLSIVGVVTSVFGIGLLVLLFVAVWVIVDAFSLPRWVREHNAGMVEPIRQPAMRPSSRTKSAGRSHRMSARDRIAQDRILLLKEAEKRSGRLTVKHGVLATGKSFGEVERILNEMVDSGYVDVDNDPGSGVVVYDFGD